MPSEQQLPTMAAIPSIPGHGLATFSVGAIANGNESGNGHLKLVENSKQQGLVSRAINGNSVISGYNYYDIGIPTQEAAKPSEMNGKLPMHVQASGFIGSSSPEARIHKTFSRERPEVVSQPKISKQIADKMEHFTPMVHPDFALNEYRTLMSTPYNVTLPTYNFTSHTFEHRVVDPAIAIKNLSKTTKSFRVAKIPVMEDSMPRILKFCSHPENGAAGVPPTSPPSRNQRKNKVNTPKKRTPKKADTNSSLRYEESINRTVSAARELAGIHGISELLHPERPASAIPSETVRGIDVTKQRARHRSSEGGAIPKKSRKKHSRSLNNKRRSEPIPSYATIKPSLHNSSRRVIGQYPERIIISNNRVRSSAGSPIEPSNLVQPPHQIARNQFSSPHGPPSFAMSKPNRDELIRHILGNTMPSVSQSGLSTTAISTPVSTSAHGPQVFSVDSVIPPSGEKPVLECLIMPLDSLQSNISHMDEPLDYSMKTLRKLESETTPLVGNAALDLSLPKQESARVSSAPGVIGHGGMITVSSAINSSVTNILTASSKPQPTVLSNVVEVNVPTSRCDQSSDTANSLKSEIPITVVSLASGSPIAAVDLGTKPSQPDTSNLDTLCAVALGSTPPRYASVVSKSDKQPRKRRSPRKIPKKHSAGSSKPKLVQHVEPDDAASVAKSSAIPSASLNGSSPCLEHVKNPGRGTTVNNKVECSVRNQSHIGRPGIDILLTPRLDEVQVSEDEWSDTTETADELLDTISTLNDSVENVESLSKENPTSSVQDMSHPVCDVHSSQDITASKTSTSMPADKESAVETIPEQKEKSKRGIEAVEETIPVHEKQSNHDKCAMGEKILEQKEKSEHHDGAAEETMLEQNEESLLTQQISEETTSEPTLHKSKVGESVSDETDEIVQPGKRASPNVSIQRLNSNEMRSNFSVRSVDGVIPIRPESLSSIMKKKSIAVIKTEPIENLEEASKRTPANDDQHIVTDLEASNRSEGDENVMIFTDIRETDPDINLSNCTIKSEHKEVPFMPRVFCHSPIDLNEACCDEYDNMCRDLDGHDDDCVEIISDSSPPDTIDHNNAENGEPVQQDHTEPEDSKAETETRLSPSHSSDTAGRRQLIANRCKERTKLMKCKKKKRRFRLGMPKRKTVVRKKSHTRKNTSNVIKSKVNDRAKVTQDSGLVKVKKESNMRQEEFRDDFKSVVAFPTEISEDGLKNDMFAAVSPKEHGSDVSPSKRTSLKLGYKLNMEFGNGVSVKRRKLIKLEEKPHIASPPKMPIHKDDSKPILLLDSSESSDDESSIFKTEKAKKLIKKCNIQNKMAMNESKKIVRKAKYFMVNKEPNRSPKKRRCLKKEHKSIAKSSITPSPSENSDETRDMCPSKPSTSVNQGTERFDSLCPAPRSRLLRPNGSRFILSRGKKAPLLVTRRDSYLARPQPQKHHVRFVDELSDRHEELKSSSILEETEPRRTTILLKSFVRDPKEDGASAKSDVEVPDSNISVGVLNQTTNANTIMDNKLGSKVERQNDLGIKSILKNKSISKVKSGLPHALKLTGADCKENFDPDKESQFLNYQSSHKGSTDGGSDLGSTTSSVSPSSEFATSSSLTVIFQGSRDATAVHQPNPITTEVNEMADHHKAVVEVSANDDSADNSIADSLDENKDQPDSKTKIDCGVSLRTDAESRCDSTPPIDLNNSAVLETKHNVFSETCTLAVDVDSSRKDHRIMQQIAGVDADTPALSVTVQTPSSPLEEQYLPPPPLKDECLPFQSLNTEDETSQFTPASDKTEFSDSTTVQNELDKPKDVPTAQSTADSESFLASPKSSLISGDTDVASDGATTSQKIRERKSSKARMKVKWSSKDVVTSCKTKRPSYFEPVKITKAKRDRKIYKTMQKLLNMGLIVDKANSGSLTMQGWPASVDRYGAGETSRSRAASQPLPPRLTSEDHVTVKRECEPEEDLSIKPCFVALEKL